MGFFYLIDSPNDGFERVSLNADPFRNENVEETNSSLRENIELNDLNPEPNNSVSVDSLPVTYV